MTGSISVAETIIERGRDDGVTVTVRDADGNTLARVFCTLAIVSQPGRDARLETSFGTTDADGQVATTLHVGRTTGTIQLQARCSGLIMGADVLVVAPPPGSLPDSGYGGIGLGTDSYMGTFALLLASAGGTFVIWATLGHRRRLDGSSRACAAASVRQQPDAIRRALELARRNGLVVEDRRSSGGALWIIAGEGWAPALAGLGFAFALSGGRATGDSPAWYWSAFD